MNVDSWFDKKGRLNRTAYAFMIRDMVRAGVIPIEDARRLRVFLPVGFMDSEHSKEGMHSLTQIGCYYFVHPVDTEPEIPFDLIRLDEGLVIHGLNTSRLQNCGKPPVPYSRFTGTYDECVAFAQRYKRPRDRWGLPLALSNAWEEEPILIKVPNTTGKGKRWHQRRMLDGRGFSEPDWLVMDRGGHILTLAELGEKIGISPGTLGCRSSRFPFKDRTHPLFLAYIMRPLHTKAKYWLAPEMKAAAIAEEKFLEEQAQQKCDEIIRLTQGRFFAELSEEEIDAIARDLVAGEFDRAKWNLLP